MKTGKTLRVIFWVVAITGLVAVPHAARAASFSQLDLDSSKVSWNTLSFQAENWLVSVKIDVRLTPSALKEADLLWGGKPAQNPWPPSTWPIYDLTVDTLIDPLVGSTVRLLNQALLDPRDAAALRRIRLRRGKGDQKKTYRFARSGVFMQRTQPAGSQEISLEPEGWTDLKDRFYACDRIRRGCPAITVPEAIIYIVSSAVSAPDSRPISLCVFSNEQLHHVRLVPEGLHTLKVDYLEKDDQGGHRRQGSLKALQIALKAESMSSGQEEKEVFSFLGFKENIVIYIDPASHIPIQVSGVIPGTGHVDLKLQKAILNKTAD